MNQRFRIEYIKLFRLGLPVLVTQLGIIVVSFADTMMVGHYGTPELSSAAFVNSLFVIPFVMQIGFASGLTPLVGALYSRGALRRCGFILKTGLRCNALLSLIFIALMGVLYFFIPYLGQDPELLPIIREYYLIVLISLFPAAIFSAFQQTANGATDTAMPMWVMLGGNLLNILGNWMLIWGVGGMPRLGLTGAGLSTLICRSLMALVIFLLFMRRQRYASFMAGMRARIRNSGVTSKIVQTSYPIMIQSGVECLLWSVGAVVCGEFGRIQIAAYQVVNTIGQLGFMIYMSFSTAVAIRVANFTGLGDSASVRVSTSAGLHMLLALGTLSSLVFIFFSRPLIWSFTSDSAVIETALALIPPLVLYQYGDAVQLNYANALRGMADVKPLLNVSLISYILIGCPVLYLLAKFCNLGAMGVYYSFSVALFAAGTLLIVAYRRHFGDSRNFRNFGNQVE
ncbi:MAG: MATE family efflux transporter [Clostridium sp.]|nr:MATE family efflux transporter [Prevotella sp.]MCM1428567.1 MATE family efflux transporter [Clostridium sp.]MCM1475032.1 MATE family efflux transporter [Muribaculaceae bacterium]